LFATVPLKLHVCYIIISTEEHYYGGIAALLLQDHLKLFQRFIADSQTNSFDSLSSNMDPTE